MKIYCKKRQELGFTLIELIVVVAIFTILIGISTISLSNLIPNSNFATSNQTFISDIKTQQFKAMTGNVDNSGNENLYGIYLESNQYTLFSGPIYNPSSPENFVISLPTTVNIANISFASSSIIFLQNSGDISNFDSNAASFQLINTTTGTTETFTFNKFGVATN